MKKLTTAIVISAISFSANAQINVSGGVYANTTWTLVNSPYIVVDTVVVFPGVTLTIEPGVIVKFDANEEIEIRQAKLIANGTSVDSITFTSNSLSPTAGIYSGIYLNGGTHTSTFDYCKFKYANIGIKSTVADSMIVNNSNFKQDSIGLQFIGNGTTAIASVENNVFNNNTNGLILKNLHSSKINYCNFLYNGTSGLIVDDGGYNMTINYCNFLYNGIGVLWNMHSSIINHCHFSNNVTGLQENGFMNMNDIFNNTTKNSIFNFNQSGLEDIGFMLIDSCTINRNQTGINGAGYSPIKNCTIDSNTVLGIATANDQVMNCNIKYNGEGIHGSSNLVISGNDIEYNTGDNINITGNFGTITITDNTIRYGNFGIDNTQALTMVIKQNLIENNNVGINLNSSATTLTCNRICNNTSYGLKYYANANLNGTHNYWCTTDSASTEILIYDGYDNISYGIVSILPFDTLCFTGPTSVNEITQENLFSIYPNPSAGVFTIKSENENIDRIEIMNMLGEKVLDNEIHNSSSEIDLSDMANGIYFIRVKTKTRLFTQKIIVNH